MKDGAWNIGGLTLTRETAISNLERKNLATTSMKNLYTFLRAYSLSSLLWTCAVSIAPLDYTHDITIKLDYVAFKLRVPEVELWLMFEFCPCLSKCATVDRDKNYVPIIALLLGYVEEQRCHNSYICFIFFLHYVTVFFNYRTFFFFHLCVCIFPFSLSLFFSVALRPDTSLGLLILEVF